MGKTKGAMQRDGKRDEDEAGYVKAGRGGAKRSLWQDTQTCACQDKIPRSVRRKFISKTKRKEAERDTQDWQQRSGLSTPSLLRGAVHNKTWDKDAALAFRPTDAEEKNE